VLRDSAPAGTARGLAFALAEGLGAVTRRSVAKQVTALSPSDRHELGRLGVSIGRLAVFLPALQRADAMRLRARLFAVRRGLPPEVGRGVPRPAGHARRISSSMRLFPRRPARGPRPARASRCARVACRAGLRCRRELAAS
jgi:ATP-dependent RNA helicase SUPV3L1/SUV3